MITLQKVAVGVALERAFQRSENLLPHFAAVGCNACCAGTWVATFGDDKLVNFTNWLQCLLRWNVGCNFVPARRPSFIQVVAMPVALERGHRF